MAQFILVRIKADKHPAFVKIGCFGCGACINQHLGCIDAVGLGANPVDPVPETGKHFAPDFPAIKLCRWISGGCPGHCGTDCVDHFA